MFSQEEDSDHNVQIQEPVQAREVHYIVTILLQHFTKALPVSAPITDSSMKGVLVRDIQADVYKVGF